MSGTDVGHSSPSSLEKYSTNIMYLLTKCVEASCVIIFVHFCMNITWTVVMKLLTQLKMYLISVPWKEISESLVPFVNFISHSFNNCNWFFAWVYELLGKKTVWTIPHFPFITKSCVFFVCCTMCTCVLTPCRRCLCATFELPCWRSCPRSYGMTWWPSSLPWPAGRKL